MNPKWKQLAVNFLEKCKQRDFCPDQDEIRPLLKMGRRLVNFDEILNIPEQDSDPNVKIDWLSQLQQFESSSTTRVAATFVLMDPDTHLDLFRHVSTIDPNYVTYIEKQAARFACQSIIDYMGEMPDSPEAQRLASSAQPSEVSPDLTGNNDIDFINDAHASLARQGSEDENLTTNRDSSLPVQVQSDPKPGAGSAVLEQLVEQVKALHCSNNAVLDEVSQKIAQKTDALQQELRDEIRDELHAVASDIRAEMAALRDVLGSHKGQCTEARLDTDERAKRENCSVATQSAELGSSDQVEHARPQLSAPKSGIPAKIALEKLVNPVGKMVRSIFGGISDKNVGGAHVLSTRTHFFGAGEPRNFTGQTGSGGFPAESTRGATAGRPASTNKRWIDVDLGGNSGGGLPVLTRASSPRLGSRLVDPNRVQFSQTRDPGGPVRGESDRFFSYQSRPAPSDSCWRTDGCLKPGACAPVDWSEGVDMGPLPVRGGEDRCVYVKPAVSVERLKLHKEITGYYRDYPTSGQWSKWYAKFSRLESPTGTPTDNQRVLNLLSMLLEGQAKDTFLNIPEGDRTLEYVLDRFSHDFDCDEKKTPYQLVNSIAQKENEKIMTLVTRIQTALRDCDPDESFGGSHVAFEKFMCEVLDGALLSQYCTEAVLTASTFDEKVQAALTQEKLIKFQTSGHRGLKKSGGEQTKSVPVSSGLKPAGIGRPVYGGTGGRVSAVGPQSETKLFQADSALKPYIRENEERAIGVHTPMGGVLSRGGGSRGGPSGFRGAYGGSTRPPPLLSYRGSVPSRGYSGPPRGSSSSGRGSVHISWPPAPTFAPPPSFAPPPPTIWRAPSVPASMSGVPKTPGLPWYLRPRSQDLGAASVATERDWNSHFESSEQLYRTDGWEFGDCGFVYPATSPLHNYPPNPDNRWCFRCGRNNHTRDYCEAVAVNMSTGKVMDRDEQCRVNLSRRFRTEDKIYPVGSWNNRPGSRGRAPSPGGGTRQKKAEEAAHKLLAPKMTGVKSIARVEDISVDSGGGGSKPRDPPVFRLGGHSVVSRQNKQGTRAAAAGGHEEECHNTPVATTGFSKLWSSFETGEAVKSDNSDFHVSPRSESRTSSVSGESSTVMTPPPLSGKCFSFRPGAPAVLKAPQPPSEAKGGTQLSDTRKRSRKKVSKEGSEVEKQSRADLNAYDSNVFAVVQSPLKLTQDADGTWQSGKFQRVLPGVPTHTGARVYVDLGIGVEINGVAEKAVARSLLDTGAGPSLISTTLLEKLGWTELVTNAPILGLTGANGDPLQSPGCIHMTVTMAGQEISACFMVVPKLAELILVGQNILEALDIAFYSREKRVFVGNPDADGIWTPVPTFVQNLGVVSLVDTFDDRIFSVREGSIKPNHTHIVEVDISNLPIGGSYILRPSEVVLGSPHIAIPNMIINRHSSKEMTCGVPVLNVSQFHVKFSPSWVWLHAVVVCSRSNEAKHVFDPEARKRQCLVQLHKQLADAGNVAGVSLKELVGPGGDHKKYEHMLSAVLREIIDTENASADTKNGGEDVSLVLKPIVRVGSLTDDTVGGDLLAAKPIVRVGTSVGGSPTASQPGDVSSCGGAADNYVFGGRSSSSGIGSGVKEETEGSRVAGVMEVKKSEGGSGGIENGEKCCDDDGAPGIARSGGLFSSLGTGVGGGEVVDEQESDGHANLSQAATAEAIEVDDDEEVGDDSVWGWAEQEPISDREVPGTSAMHGRPGIDVPAEDSVLADVPGLTLIDADITDDEKRQLWLVLETVHEVFARSSMDVGNPPQEFFHRIDTGDAKPVSQKLRRLAMAQREELQKIIKEMLENGIIEPCSSPWASPAVLVAKKDGTWRFCVDYRQLNKLTVDDSYPCPRVDDTLASLRGNSHYSVIDCQLGYWAIPVSEEDRPKTAFLVEEGQFLYTRMPFGLKTAPMSWNRMISTLLSQHLGSLCSCFFDDIIIFGRTFAEHLVNLAAVLGTVRDSGLLIKGKKCHFARKRVEFLGHVVSEKGIEPQPDKISKIIDSPLPTTVRQLRGVIGLLSYYRKFIPGFATIAAPLYDLCKGKGKLKEPLSEECVEAIATLQKAITTAPILGYPVVGKPFRIYTDASGVGMGAVLSQVDDDGNEYVIEYASKKFTATERLYCTSERECYAVVWALRHFKAYILYDEVTLYTDHSALTFIINSSNPQYQANYVGKYGRWMMELQSFNLRVEYRKGDEMGHADALSRPPFIHAVSHEPIMAVCMDQPYPLVHAVDFADSCLQLVPTLADVDAVSPDVSAEKVAAGEVILNPLTPVEVAEAQKTDDFCRLIKAKLLMTPCELEPEKSQKMWLTARIKEFSVCPETGVVRHFHARREGFCSSRAFQLVVPSRLKGRLLDQLHCNQFGGHLGFDKIYSVAEQRYWWIGMRRDIQLFCQGCPKCEIMKHSNKSVRLEMVPIKVRYPFYRVGLDVLGPFVPSATTGNRYAIVFGDYFTKWVEVYLTVDQTTKTVRRCLEDFIGRFGCIAELHTDQGPQMTAENLKLVTKGLGIRHVLSTPHHHQSLGLIERFNKTFGNMLRCFVDKHDHATWDRYVPGLLMAYRCAVQASTGQTPYFLVFGRDPVLPHDLEYGTEEEGSNDIVDYAADAYDRQRYAWDWARKNIEKAQLQQKGYYDCKAKEGVIVEGDLVTKDHRYVRPGQSSKLVPKRMGPYRVVKVNFPNAVIKRVGTRRLETVHMNRLRLSQQTGLFDYPSLDETEDGEEWFCPKCNRKYDAEDNLAWVECETCGGWFDSPVCTGLTEVPTMNEVWICSQCVERYGDMC